LVFGAAAEAVEINIMAASLVIAELESFMFAILSGRRVLRFLFLSSIAFIYF
jgi:hypothetical protein